VGLRDSHIQDVMQVVPLKTQEGESWHFAP
jgi:hypothetical protein